MAAFTRVFVSPELTRTVNRSREAGVATRPRAYVAESRINESESDVAATRSSTRFGDLIVS